MSAAITLQQVNAEDAASLADLRVVAMQPSLEAVGRFDPRRARARFLDMFTPEFTRQILRAGERVGFVVVRSAGDDLLLDHLYLSPGAQGQGIGAAALKTVIAEARAARKTLRVSALKQSRSNDFYVRHGFELAQETEWDNHYVLRRSEA